MDPSLGKRIRIRVKAHGRDLGVFEANREKRMRRLEMKNCRRNFRAGAQHIFKRSVERNRIIYAEKLNAAAAERIRVARDQLPVMFFAAEAEDGHARTTNAALRTAGAPII